LWVPSLSHLSRVEDPPDPFGASTLLGPKVNDLGNRTRCVPKSPRIGPQIRKPHHCRPARLCTQVLTLPERGPVPLSRPRPRDLRPRHGAFLDGDQACLPGSVVYYQALMFLFLLIAYRLQAPTKQGKRIGRKILCRGILKASGRPRCHLPGARTRGIVQQLSGGRNGNGADLL
jgi:hypothetical protein